MQDKISSISIDSTEATTTLCNLGAAFGTDKSPYSTTWHRHPYTSLYTLLFASKRYDSINFGELGILDNSSMKMWREYFPNARIFGFEHFPDKIESARAAQLPRVIYESANVKDETSIFGALNASGVLFDILIDDSTHLFEDQIRFVEVAVSFMRPGGLLIIEDVFRGWEESRYRDALAKQLPYFDDPLFVEANHAKAFSGGNTQEPYFDNDKLLVLCRNNLAMSVMTKDEADRFDLVTHPKATNDERIEIYGLAPGDNIDHGQNV